MAAFVVLGWQRYLDSLHDKPLQTKALTSATLAACSDMLAQRLSSPAPLNWRRTATVALFGLLWSGPANHYWQAVLERIFPPGKGDAMRRWGVCGGEGRGGAAHGPPHTRMHAPTPPRTHATHSVKKVALDQLTFGPLNNICVMLFFAVVVEGRSLRYARGKIARDYPTVQARAPGGCCCCPCCCTPLLLLLLLGMVCARRQRWWCPAPATRARALPHARSLAGARLAAVAGGAVDQPGIRAAQGEEGVGQVVGGRRVLVKTIE